MNRNLNKITLDLLFSLLLQFQSPSPPYINNEPLDDYILNNSMNNFSIECGTVPGRHAQERNGFK